MTTNNTLAGYLTGQLIMAMPSMTDPRFERAVIFICLHNEEGAMGLVINRLMEALTFDEMLKQLGIQTDNPEIDDLHIHFGGPVEIGRGFVLHSSDYSQQGTVMMENGIGLTATVDILADIADGHGPREKLLALGYAGWGPGQLDEEIQKNTWLHCPSDAELVFGEDLENKWEDSMAKIGIDLSLLSGDAGHA